MYLTNPKERQTCRKRGGMARIAIVGIISGLAIGLFAGVFTWVVSKPSFTVSNELDVALRQVLKGEFDLANAIAEKHKLEELEQKSDKAKKELVEGCHAWMQSQKSLDHQVSFERAEVALQHLLEAEKYGFPEGYDGLGNFVLGWCVNIFSKVTRR